MKWRKLLASKAPLRAFLRGPLRVEVTLHEEYQK